MPPHPNGMRAILGILLATTLLSRATVHGAAPLLRQQVVIFVVDSNDAFHAHGDYVQSVIQQQCPACSMQPANLHGNLTMPNIFQAFQSIEAALPNYPDTTTVLVNISLGTYVYDEAMHALVRRLRVAGALLIASAGNDATETPFYPAAFPEVLAVCASTRHTKKRAAYSNFGPWVSLCAPGLQYVAQPLHAGSTATGTSFASPMVAGMLGQLLLDAPCAAPETARRALLRTAEPRSDAQEGSGAGVVNAAAAAQYLQSLYACEQPTLPWRQRLLNWGERLGNRLVAYGVVLLYFLASIFAFPFALAYAMERYQRRQQRRQQEAIARAYEGSPEYRQQRLAVLRARSSRRRRVRWHEQAELTALVEAVALYHEPCWWCDRPAARPSDAALREDTGEPALLWCQRCQQTLTEIDEASC